MQIRTTSARDLLQVEGLAMVGAPSETLQRILAEFESAALKADEEAAASATAQPREHAWIVDCTGGEYENVSRYAARCKRASWARLADFDQVSAQTADFVILMGHEADVQLEKVFLLMEQYPRTSVAIMAARSPEELSSIIVKNLVYAYAEGGSDVCVAPLLAGSEPIVSASLTVYPDQVPAPVNRLHEPLRALSVCAHGNEDYVIAGPQQRFCGRRRVLDMAHERSGGHLGVTETAPACVVDDTCAFEGDELLHPPEVKARAVLLNTCLSAKGSVSLFGRVNDFSVGQAFLDGWAAALLASPMLKESTLGENLLFHALVDSGATMGECARAVNDHMRHTGIDAPSVVLWGDPELRLAPQRPREDWPRVEARSDDTGLHLRVPAGTKPTGFVELAAEFAHKLVPEVVAGDVGDSLFWFRGRLPAGEGILLLPLDPEYRVRSELSVTFREAEHSATTRYIADSLRAVDRLRFLGVYADGHKSGMRGAAQSLPALVKLEADARLDLGLFSRFEKRRQPVLDALEESDSLVLNKLLKTTHRSEFHFVEGYRSIVETKACVARNSCPYCGEVVLEYECSSLHDPDMRRFLSSCPVCGANQDTDRPDVTLLVDCESPLVTDEDVPFSVVVRNDSPLTVKGRIGGSFTHGVLDGFEVRMADSQICVDPRGSATVEGHFRMFSPVSHHTKRLRVYIVAGGRILFAGRSFGVSLSSISPKPAHS